MDQQHYLADRLDALEKKQESFEHNQAEVLNLLRKIEGRLVGNLEEDRPGLNDEVRTLKKIVESIDEKITNQEKLNTHTRLESLESTVASINKEVKELTRYRLIAYGIIIAIIFILEKAWDFILGKK